MENGDLLVVTGLHEIIYRVQPNGRMDMFLEDANAEKLVSPANPAFGGSNLDELYITNLMGNSVSKISEMPRGQELYHQM
jgi:sugar lactone lactonase YvrE